MQTGSAHVLIEVSPSRLELAVVRGRRVLRSAVRRLTPANPAPAFELELRELQTALSGLVTEAECRGLGATVIYHSSASAVLLSSAPTTLSAADAEESAKLALAGVADFPLDGVPVCCATMSADAPVGSAKQAARQAHVLCAADTAGAIDAIAAWVEAASLRFDGAIPVSAVAMHGAALGAWNIGRRAGDRAAVLWIGEHGSALACVTEGSVRFVRTVGVGLESLVDALCQPLRSRDDSAPELKLSRDDSRRLLAGVGVPSPEMQLPGLPGFTGSAILPVLQPALQRISIEAKQSLRFGLPEQERAAVRMQIVGPGAAVAGLGEWITRQCGLPMVESPALPDVAAAQGERGAIAAVLEAGHQLPILVPESMARRTLRRNARVALAVGVTLAAVWIGAEWYTAREELAVQRPRLEALEAAARTGEAAARLRDINVAAQAALHRVESRIATVLGTTVDARGVLDAIALAAPTDVRLTTIELAEGESTIDCHISGFVRVSESADPTKAITGFVDALSATPIIRTVRLGATQRTRIDGAQSHAFELSLELVPLPRQAAVNAATTPIAASEENRP